jgi:hypothetical protein
VIQLINNAGAEIREGENGIDLCRHILERAASNNAMPTGLAIKALKSEIRKLF